MAETIFSILLEGNVIFILLCFVAVLGFLVFFFFGSTTWLAGSRFPDEGSMSESLES